MTKKTKTKAKKSQPSAPAPDLSAPAPAPSAHARESFLPSADPPRAPITAETSPLSVPSADGKTTLSLPAIAISIEDIGDRRIRVSLTVPPLSPCIQELFLPLQISPEKLASITHGVIQRCAEEGVTDGITQHQRRLEEELESKDRYERSRSR